MLAAQQVAATLRANLIAGSSRRMQEGGVKNRAAIRANIGYSALCLIIALVLAVWFVAPAGQGNFGEDSIVGPATWPRAMLIGISCCAALVLLRNAFLYQEAVRDGRSPVAAAADGEFDNRKAALGIIILILYVGAIPVIGFAFATAGFLLVWLPYGGVRKPRVVISVTVIGTVALLYTLGKLPPRPLDAGRGDFR